MKNWIPFQLAQGRSIGRPAHAEIPEGTYEREIGKEGFFGPAAQMLHAHPPTGWSKWEGDVRPRAFDLTRLNRLTASPWEADLVVANAHVRMRQWRMEGKMDFLARNADGDELIFIHEGAGELFCDYGHMSFRDGDYILLPRGTLWRIEATAPVTALLIEASGSSYQLPERGLVGRHAFFDPAVLETPRLDEAFEAQKSEKETRVVFKRGDKLTTITYPYNPLDVVGWHGDLAPVKLNWRDMRPLMSHRAHLPPSAHTTFVAGRFVVCTFVPRPAESDPDALKLPFFHSNDDYDEVIFYHRGKFMSRDNIHAGMVTLHPCGFTHGPHPKAFAMAAKAPGGHMLDEVAVMIDTRDALTVARLPEGVEWTGYVDSWKTKTQAAK